MATRHIGSMDITKNVDDDEYFDERVRRERAYQWHARWALPTYKEMKAQVRKAKGNLDITEDDVDLLPWGPGGMLNRREYERLQRGETTMKPQKKRRPPKTCTLFVDLPSGKTLELENIKIDHDTLADLKAKIAQAQPLLEAKRQILSKDGEKLPVGETVQEMKLQTGDHIQLTMKKVPVSVTNKATGKSYTILVDTSQPLLAMKQDLEGKCKLPVENQRLYMNGDELDDNDKAAAEYGIQGGSQLELHPTGMRVTVEMPDGRKVPIIVEGADTTEDIKKKIQQETGMEAADMGLYKKGTELPSGTGETATQMGLEHGDTLQVKSQKVPITVRTMDGREFDVEINPHNTTVQELKENLEDASGLPVSNQVLARKGKELSDNHKNLADYKVKKGTVLDLEPKSFTVHVDMPDGQKVSIDTTPNDTSKDIKKKIEAASGMPATNQILRNDQGDELPEKTAARDMGLKDGDRLSVDPKKITVQVDMPDGSKVPVSIKPTDTDKDIKKKIEKETGMDAGNMILNKDGDQLPSGQTAKDMGLQEGDNLEVEPKSMTMNVEMPDGSKVPVDIKPSDNSNDIKKKIEKKTGMEAAKQILKKDGGELPSGKSAKEMGLRDGDDLKVEPKIMTMNVEMPDGTRVEVDIKPSDTSDDIKKKIEAKTGMEAPRQVLKDSNGNELPSGQTAKDMGLKEGDDLEVEIKQVPVSVRTMDGDTIQVMVDPIGESIGDIKNKLASESGIPAHNQQLFKDGDKLDNDSKKAKDYGIKANTVLDLEPKSMTMNVEMPDGSKVPVDIKPSDNSNDIKKKIEKKTGMEAAKQILKKDGGELPSGKSAKEMGLRDGDDLKVEPKIMTMNVEMPDGTRVEVDIKPSDTSDDIKKKIEAKTGMEAPRQVLKDSNGNELPSGQTAKDMGLKEGDDLEVEIKQVPVSVRTMDGDTIQVMVDPIGESIGDIKNKLASESGIPAHNQQLFKDGDELDNDNKKASDYGVKSGTVLDLEPKIMNVTVLMPDGAKVALDVKPSDTADHLKRQIESKTGMAPEKQILKQYGDELPSGKTARDMGIRDGDDNLEVEIKKIPVMVNLPDGGQAKILVDPDEPLRNLKEDLEPVSSIPVHNQNLYKSGVLLKDNAKPVGDYGIRAGTVLDLEDEEERLRRLREEEERKRREEEEARKAREEAAARKRKTSTKPNRPPAITHGDEPLERAYRWYTRIQNPHYNGMVKMVRENKSGIDITVEHVGLLPVSLKFLGMRETQSGCSLTYLLFY